jgi:hypothetical protein
MKKTTTRARLLTLRRETLRALTLDNALGIHGGWQDTASGKPATCTNLPPPSHAVTICPTGADTRCTTMQDTPCTA